MNRHITASPLVEWGEADSALGGGSESGDLGLIQPFPGGVLAAAVDGVGHGSEAAQAARAAIGVLRQYPDESVVSLLVRCDAALARTRGAAMNLASFNEARRTLTWISVGNVEGMLLRAGRARPIEHVLRCQGVVGYRLPTLHSAVIPLTPGDTLIFATDGIAPGFDEDLPIGRTPQEIAEHIMARFYRGTDDALVLVVRWHGRMS